MVAAIASQVANSSSHRYREAASRVVGQLRSAVDSGLDAHLLLPIHCRTPPHFVAGVLNMGSGQLDVYDSFDKEVTFYFAPENGGMPDHDVAQVQLWGDWLEHTGHGLKISFNVEHNYHCLGQQDDGWRCRLYTVYNLASFARSGCVLPAAKMGGQARVFDCQTD